MEIHDKEFRHRGRNGYDRYEVDVFLDQIVDDYGDALDEIVDLKNEKVALTKQIAQFNDQADKNKAKENETNEKLKEAKEQAKKLIEEAHIEAEDIIDMAHNQADDIYEKGQKDTLAKDYNRLKSQVSEFRKGIQQKLRQEIDDLNDEDWQKALDKYFDTPRYYPEDGSEPHELDDGDLDEIDVDKENPDALESSQEPDDRKEKEKHTPQPMTGDSPSHETIAPKREDTQLNGGSTIVFPDNYKDHN